MIFAGVNENIVTGIFSLEDEDEIKLLAKSNQSIVDITNISPMPQIGWVMKGNALSGNVSSFVKIYRFISNIFRIFDKTISPIEIDYVTGLTVKLHRKSILVRGECRSEEFYENYNGTTYSNLIVKENHSFTRDSLGFAIKRDTVINWYNEDGTINALAKNLPKYYSSVEQIEEGKTRRGNLVNALQIPTIGLISIAMIGSTAATMAVIIEGRRFMADYKLEFDMFISESNKTMLECLNNPAHPKYIAVSNYSWIDFMTPYGVTIRNYIYNEMNI